MRLSYGVIVALLLTSLQQNYDACDTLELTYSHHHKLAKILVK